jgi:hypothetical protein
MIGSRCSWLAAPMLAIAASACSSTPTGLPDGVDPTDRDVAMQIELAVTDSASFEALAAQELTFQGPLTDASGERYIVMFMTGAEAASLESVGFQIRGIARPASTADGVIAHAITCPTVPPCPSNPPPTTSYFMDYDDIRAELAQMDADSDAIRTVSIGQTQVDKVDIAATSFGPAAGHDNSPTLYVLATHHAREWIGTGVALQLARWLYEVQTNGTVDGVADPALAAALIDNAVVIVPVANPDGYRLTRNGDRLQRGNANVADCGNGVDLNRNHTTTWDPPSPHADMCDAFESFRGTSRASEAETQAIELLLQGGAFPASQDPVGLISYHSFADFVVYPDGWKEVEDTEGPQCRTADGDNCFNPDFTIIRDLFGDTHSSLFVDNVSLLNGQAFPYYRDHARTLLYPASGEAGAHANYGPVPMLAISPELPSNCYGFRVECSPDADEIIRRTAADQLDVIRRIIERAPGLRDTNVATAYAPSAVGKLSSGMWTREYGPPPLYTELEARATFVKSVFLPASTGSLTAKIDGVSYAYRRGRKGAQYELFRLPLEDASLDPLCLPCEIISDPDTDQIDGAIDCEGCVKLCDPDRLVASGWSLKQDTRGGKDDCYWVPSGTDGTLEVPGGNVPFTHTTHCHLTFSAEWEFMSGQSIVVERDTASGWEPLLAQPYESPYNTSFPPTQMVSYAYEADNFISAGTVPAFRFRVDGSPPTGVKIFDPVIYCRGGFLP